MGNEYNYFTTYFNVGYAVFLIVSWSETALIKAIADYHNTDPPLHLASDSGVCVGRSDSCLVQGDRRQAGVRDKDIRESRHNYADVDRLF